MIGVNPILDEIDAKHGELSPAAQKAIALSGVAPSSLGMPTAAEQPAVRPLAAPPVARGGLGPANPALSALPANVGGMETPETPRPLGGGVAPRPLVSAGGPDQPTTATPRPIGAPPSGPLVRTPDALQSDPRFQRALQRQDELSKGAGVDQIHNPFLRGLAHVGDALAGGLFPGIAMGIPGTHLHHRLLVNENDRDLAGMESRANEEAQRQHLGAETAELPARAEHERAQAEALRNPPEKQGDPTKTLETADGIMQFNPGTGKYDIPVGQAPGKNAMQHVVTADGSVVALEHDPKTGTVNAHVVYKGDPKIETDLTDLEVGGKPHKVIVNKRTGETIKDLGPSGIKPPNVNVNAGNSALDHEIGQYGKPWQTMTSGVSSQLDKILDAEKMVAGGAMQQALGIPKVLTALVSGAGSGVRITQAELNSIAKARGIQGDIEGWFSKVKGQGQLTDVQKQQLGQILGDVRTRILQKKAIADSAIDDMQSGHTREDILAADKKARAALDQFERGGSVDPKVKAYADHFFGGDVAKAQAAIAEQQKGKK